MRRAASVVAAVALLGGCARVALEAPRTGATAGDELEAFASFVVVAHPDPFRFVTADAWGALVTEEATRLRADESPSDLTVGRAFQRVAASLHDSHMAVAQPAFQPGYEGAVSFLPFVVARVGDEVFVDASIAPLAVGTTIEVIDGRPIEAILEALSGLAIHDGVNDAARRRAVEDGFVPLYHLAFGMAPSYAITLRSSDGTVETATSSGISRDAYVGLGAQRRSSRMLGRTSELPWPTLERLERIDGATCHLRLPTFGVADTDDYEARLDTIVADAVTCTRLILDLRGNEGGYRTLGIALANHLVDVDYVQWSSSAVRILAIPPEHRAAVAPLFGSSLDRLDAYPRDESSGVHRLSGDPLAPRMTPESPRITAALALFVDGATDSAANELVLAVRSVRPDAILVGEEIGGGCVGHVGELPVSYTSPVFRVGVAMSLIRIEHVSVSGCADGHGLLPDLPVAYSADDFVTGTDPYRIAIASAWP